MNRPKQVLMALFAHPDDESYRAGGFLTLLTQSGVSVYIVTATRGESSSTGVSPLYTPEQLSSIREKELRCACQALQLQQPIVWDYPDVQVADRDPEIIIQQILLLMQEIQPQVVLSFGSDGLSGHPDHIAIGNAAAEAFQRYRKAGALYQLAVPVPVAQGLGMNQIRAVEDSQITLTVDVTSVWEAKMKAIHCHATQIASSPIMMQSEDRKQQFLGFEHFVRAADYDPKFDFVPNLLEEYIGGKMKALLNKRIAVIGVGNIGRMLLERMRIMGVHANRMLVCDSDPERAQVAAEPVGACIIDLAQPDGCEADLWLLCPGPKAILPVIEKLTPRLKDGDVVVSFAAAVPMSSLEACLPEKVSVVRVMPNMPSLVGRGLNPVCFSERTSKEARAMVMELLDELGRTVEMRDEQMNWCVGLSGAAMRSVLPAIEGMIRAGLEAGLTEENARLIAAQVVMGTAGLVKHSSLTFPELKALTPMETLDEALVERLYYDAAVGAKNKIDRLQEIIAAE